MQRAPIAILVCLGAFGAATATNATAAAKQPISFGNNLNPVSRLVELLKSLRDTCEKDAEKDEKLYDKFVCWGREVIKAKELSNKIAMRELAELKQYIEDLDAGRIELTTERVDLEKEISELTQSIDLATDQRNKENADYENAVVEMSQAIEALENALEVLRSATDGRRAVLAEVKTEVGHRAEQEAKQAETLQRAAALGDRFLSKGDALFLHRLLVGDGHGEVPTWDWKKLNRKATFKMSYKARSTKIQDVLAKILETFESNMQEAKDKEAEAQGLYDELMESKGKQLDEAKEALGKMEKENGARALSREETIDRIDLLTEQVENDDKYIKQVQEELSEKKVEWEDRAKLRYGEINAISKAIEILHNDDARDLFKRSHESQGYFFLQTGQHSKMHDASSLLQSVAHKTGDKRVLAIIEQGAPDGLGKLKGRFTVIIDKIDELIGVIESEASSDMVKKEECEKVRADNTRQAILKSRQIDDDSDTMSRLESEIAKLNELIKANLDAIAEIDEQMKQATLQRKEENDAYLVDKRDDQLAADTVQSAYDVLETFYKENDLMLVQQKSREPVPVQAGMAPPPPPTTWDSPYGGKTAEGVGVLAILSMIKEDIMRDIKKCDEAEGKALDAYNGLMNDLNLEKGDREQENIDLGGEKSTKTGAHITAKNERGQKKTDLDAILVTIADMEPGCDFYTVKFPLRTKNRQIEIDGLLNAKGILLGANTDVKDDKTKKKWEDVPRALRPKEFRDVLLQRAEVHQHQ